MGTPRKEEQEAAAATNELAQVRLSGTARLLTRHAPRVLAHTTHRRIHPPAIQSSRRRSARAALPAGGLARRPPPACNTRRSRSPAAAPPGARPSRFDSCVSGHLTVTYESTGGAQLLKRMYNSGRIP